MGPLEHAKNQDKLYNERKNARRLNDKRLLMLRDKVLTHSCDERLSPEIRELLKRLIREYYS